MLAQQAPALAAELLPNGRRNGVEWRCGSLAGEAGQSLSVRIFGVRAGLWSDFASGEAGDALDLVAAVLFAGDIRLAIDWARAWLGLTDTAVDLPEKRRGPPPQASREAARVDEAKRRQRALAMFLAASEGLAGTPAAAYLAARGIDLSELGRTPRALRFRPDIWCQEVRASLPAMLGAITDGQGEHIATHRTWLARTPAGVWAKAPLREVKKTFGSYAGGFIPLQRGASGKPLRAAPDGETVAIAEGIETALSVAVACPHLRVLAAVALSNMARIVLPDSVRTVILCADNDRPGNQAAKRGLLAAIAHFSGPGRIVRLARPPAGKDFNDTLRANA